MVNEAIPDHWYDHDSNNQKIPLQETRSFLDISTNTYDNALVYTATHGNKYSSTSVESQNLSPCIGYWNHTPGSGSSSSGGGGQQTEGGGSSSNENCSLEVIVRLPDGKGWVSSTDTLGFETDAGNSYYFRNAWSESGKMNSVTVSIPVGEKIVRFCKNSNTVHAWPEKKLTLQASANSNYAFVGWYDNAAGTGQALSANTTYEPNAPSTATEITYYAKFKETRTLTINALLDGSNSTTAVDYVKINNETITKSGTSYSKIVDKGSSVSFEAAAKSGYTLSGIYTTDNGNSTATSPLNPINSNTTYYARFTTNSYNVTANAYYSNNGGSSYTAGNSGGTVKAGSIDAGATSTASVKYKASVTLVATPQSGYVFDGWYNAASGGTKVSGDASYSYTLNTANNVNVYARFIGQTWEIGHGTSSQSNWNYNTMTVSGDTVTGSLTLTEGQNFSFKIRKTVGSAKTYYGAASSGVSYQNITSTTFISNLTLSSPGNDIYMKGHAGTYTFTFNKSTNVLNVTASYSNITITLDSSSTTWIADASAMVYCDTDGSGYLMTKNSSSNWTAQVPSNKAGTFSFKRNNPENTATWNQWNPSDSRGYRTTYKTTGDGTGSWQ